MSQDAAESFVDQPNLVALHRYWRSKFVGPALPGRAAIDPIEIGPLLPLVFLIDVAATGTAFRYRLIGTGIVRYLGRDFTGRWVDADIYGDLAPTMIGILRSTLDQRDVTAARARIFGVPGDPLLSFTWTMMPLAADGATIDMLLCGFAPQNRRRTSTDPLIAFNEFDLILEPAFVEGGPAPVASDMSGRE